MLRFIESFDHYTTSTQFLSKWTGFNSSLFIGTGGRFNRGWVSGPAGGRAFWKTLDSQADWIVGAAVKWGSALVNNQTVFGLYDTASSAQVSLQTDTAGVLKVRNGAGTTLATGTKVMGLGLWYYIEFKATIANAGGAYEVRIDGATEMSGSGDTQQTANATANTIFFTDNANFAGNISFDDIYICDGQAPVGAGTDDFLGDVRVEALYPNGNGNSSQFVGQDANSTDNYLNVDETTPDDDTTYNESPTVGQEDTYAYTNLSPTSGTVFGVQPLMWARKTDAGLRTVASVARHSGTEEDSADHTLSTGYQYLRDVRETKPGGGVWTIADVNGAEFGVKVTT